MDRTAVAHAPLWSNVYVRLGRVSNLPTVWTNVIAGAVLGGGALVGGSVVATAIAMSLFYTGGMYLNDAFDAPIDRVERPERPIASGEVTTSAVLRIGLALIGSGIVLLLLGALAGPARGATVFAGVALGAAIVLYDLWHEANPFGPFVMGVCRGLVYVCAALATGGGLTLRLLFGALIMTTYVAGLTFTAKRNWMGHRVALLIAGISLVDALLVAAAGFGVLAAICASGCLLTLALQSRVRGT